jgi:hypothetical protein
MNEAFPAQSPLTPLIPALQRSPFAVAPERQNELKALIEHHKVQGILKFEDSLASALVMAKQVYLGLSSLEKLWAHCWVTTWVWNEWQSRGFKGELDLSASQEGITTLEFMRWALSTNQNQWPASLPKPTPTTNKLMPGLVNEFFLGACGFAILHEIRHITEYHKPEPETSQKQQLEREFDADRWAYRWIMEKWVNYADEDVSAGDERVCVKRLWSIAGMLALIAILEMGTHGSPGQRTHPNPIDRITQFLDDYVTESSSTIRENIEGFVVSVLSLHLFRRRADYDKGARYGSAADFLAANRHFFE